MKTLLLAAPLTLALHLAAASQEAPPTWVETRFHRVHLRNGNFIDGQVLQQTAKGVVLQIKPSGDFTVRRDLIQRVEYIKMRSLKEVPQLPVAETAPDPATAAAATKKPRPDAPRSQPGSSSVPAHFRPELVQTIDSLLIAHGLARTDMRQDLAVQIRQHGPEGIEYACWRAKHGLPNFEMPLLIEAIGRLEGPAVLPALLNISATAPDSFDRAAAVTALASLRTPEARAAVHRALGDPSGQVWRVASEEILKLHEKGQADVEALVALLKEREDKGVIATTLGKIGNEAAFEALRGLLSQGSSKDKVAAMRALGAAGNAEDGEAALGAIDDADPSVRRDACLFLGKMKHGPAVRRLIDLLKDEDDGLAQGAHWSLKQITGLSLQQKPDSWEDWWVQAGKKKFAPEEDK